jgi:hypothetical protein
MSEMEDVMLTNSFAVEVGGKEFMGLFADLSVSFAYGGVLMGRRLTGDRDLIMLASPSMFCGWTAK